MEMVVHAVWLIVGLALLSFGADWLVKGASELALRAKVSPLVVGLTVVAFGTSAPELIVSLKANLDVETQPDIAVGNVIGSNICNIALLLGLAALIRPFTVHSQVVRRELPILLVVTAVFVALLIDGRLERWAGFAMVAGIIFYVTHSIRLARRNPHDPALAAVAEVEGEALAKTPGKGTGPVLASAGWVALGLAGLIFGADRLVESGVAIARALEISELVIGLTLVAIGTSLPELATTLAASRRGQTDLIAGNLIGSNLFNILVVMGVTGSVKAVVMDDAPTIDLAVMSLFTLLLVPFLMRGARLSRIEGGVMVAGYLVYCAWLVRPQWFGV